MMPYIGYVQAKRSLKLAKETIELMNDPNNYMLEAQKDMLELEVEHFREASIKFTIVLLTLVTFCVTLYYLYVNGVFNV
jgi:uncharacterized Rmd1/YagE family protein